MKPLPPAIREKKRYLKFKIHSDQVFEFEKVSKEIWGYALNYMGAKATGKANHWFIKNQYNLEDQKGIIKVEKSSLEDFRACLTLINSIENEKAFIEVLGVSGSIKKLENF